MNDDERDGDVTKPDLPSSLGAGDDETNPGVGTGEGYISYSSHAYRAVAALEAMERACPPPGATGRGRYFEVLANGWGDLGMLAFDTRRITLAHKREEEDNT